MYDMDCVEISIDPSNAHNVLASKTLGLGLGVVVETLIKIRIKYDNLWCTTTVEKMQETAQQKKMSPVTP